MAKVIKIDDIFVYIGQEDGSMVKVKKDSISWDVQVGENVEVYESNNEIVVSRFIEKMASSIDPYNQNLNRVNKLTYILLAIFLGGIGIHKFYAGKSGIGILYFLFCWTFVPSIIALIEGFVAIGKHGDSNGMISV